MPRLDARRAAGHEETPTDSGLGAMILSISLPRELVKEMDTLIRTNRYRGRSEIIRSALRDFVKAQRQEERMTGRVNAIISLCYPEHIERSISDVRHSHNDIVVSMLHAHTARNQCATVLLSEGDHEKMKRFLAELRGLRELSSIDVVLV